MRHRDLHLVCKSSHLPTIRVKKAVWTKRANLRLCLGIKQQFHRRWSTTQRWWWRKSFAVLTKNARLTYHPQTNIMLWALRRSRVLLCTTTLMDTREPTYFKKVTFLRPATKRCLSAIDGASGEWRQNIKKPLGIISNFLNSAQFRFQKYPEACKFTVISSCRANIWSSIIEPKLQFYCTVDI